MYSIDSEDLCILYLALARSFDGSRVASHSLTAVQNANLSSGGNPSIAVQGPEVMGVL